MSNCVLLFSRELESSLRDSGISLESPLTASTPILNHDKNLKRKSLQDESFPNKRQKSISINGADETDIDCTLLELRPRKLSDDELHETPALEEIREYHDLIAIEDKSGDYEDKNQMWENSAGKTEKNVRGVLCLQNYSEGKTLPRLFASSDDIEENLDEDHGETISIKSGDLDDDDVEQFRKENDSGIESGDKHSSDEKCSSQSEEEDKSLSPSSSCPSSGAESSPSKYLCLSEDKLLALKRKQVLKKIKKLPISGRHIVHGRNLLPWNQKVKLKCIILESRKTVWTQFRSSDIRSDNF